MDNFISLTLDTTVSGKQKKTFGRWDMIKKGFQWMPETLIKSHAHCWAKCNHPGCPCPMSSSLFEAPKLENLKRKSSAKGHSVTITQSYMSWTTATVPKVRKIQWQMKQETNICSKGKIRGRYCLKYSQLQWFMNFHHKLIWYYMLLYLLTHERWKVHKEMDSYSTYFWNLNQWILKKDSVCPTRSLLRQDSRRWTRWQTWLQ